MTPRLYISEMDATATADEAIFSRYRLDKLRAAKSAARRAEGICAERLLIYALRDTMPEIEFPVEIGPLQQYMRGVFVLSKGPQPFENK